ncbi:hypothetical protein MKW92_027550 [Papaver armeniacum]|nr:hypothetical protein MKW92_027550 [Papaver armeniacum]
MNSSSYSSITDRYEGRFIQRLVGDNLRIFDKESKCEEEEEAITDQKEEQQHRPDVSTIDLEEEEAIPYIIVVQGPPNVGKSLLIKSLVKVFTKQYLNDIRGPITLVSGKHRRLQFVECPNDVNGMIDAAKYADLVLLCIDASYGFEMETFEFFNLLQVHGSPNIVGVLSHLDKIKSKVTETKQRLSRQFWNEIYDGAELFYLSCLDNGMYVANQIRKLAKFISVMKFNPLSWQTAYPYVLVDHFEDVTSPERVHIDNKCDRNIVMYGYLRGSNLKRGTKVHIAGVGDFPLYGITSLVDPCSLPSAAKIKGVGDKERLFYAPMSGFGDLLYHKDAEYVDEINDLDEVNRMEIEGFRAGVYLKLEVRDVPFALTKNIDPHRPILIGGISLEEENVGYVQARLKQHSWHLKLLETRDPIVVSVGWRRYQTRPVYAQEGDGNRLHQIHHIPNHTDCLAMFWGPLVPQDTGIVAVHNLAGNKVGFRISAMGFILGFTEAAEIVAKIVKKRNQVKTPLRIFKKTALIKDVFTSDLEIDWFEGAAIQTASGVRGNFKKGAKKKPVSELTRKGDQPREGTASWSFQHQNSLSNKVFMRVSEQVGGQQTIEQRRAVVFTQMKPRCGTISTICKVYQPKRRPKESEEELSKKELAGGLLKKNIVDPNERAKQWRYMSYKKEKLGRGLPKKHILDPKERGQVWRHMIYKKEKKLGQRLLKKYTLDPVETAKLWRYMSYTMIGH